jgi:hypothetical protein
MMSNRLKWEVFVSGQIPVVTNDLPPGATEMKWSKAFLKCCHAK